LVTGGGGGAGAGAPLLPAFRPSCLTSAAAAGSLGALREDGCCGGIGFAGAATVGAVVGFGLVTPLVGGREVVCCLGFASESDVELDSESELEPEL